MIEENHCDSEDHYEDACLHCSCFSASGIGCSSCDENTVLINTKSDDDANSSGH